MGLETLFLVALAGTAGAAAAGAFKGKPSKPTFPTIIPTRTTLKSTRTKIKGEEERAKAFLASRDKRGRSREASQIVMPGYLDEAQIKRPTLSDVLG